MPSSDPKAAKTRNEDAPAIVGTGKRLKAKPTELLARTAFAHELEGVAWLWDGLNKADMAQLVELVRLGLIPDDKAGELAVQLLEFDHRGHTCISWDPGLGDIYNNRSAHLKAAQVAGIDWLHAGRARREATTIAWKLVCRKELVELGAAVLELVEALCARAKAEAGTVAPSYTYWQVAQPTTLGHYLASFVGPLLRDLDRIQAAIERANSSPAGSGSTSGTSIPLSRDRLAELLGFTSQVRNTRDAMWQHDLAIEFASVACSVAATVDRLAEDLYIWSTAEFGFFECFDGHARTSVIMPQKKNPYGLAYLRGASRSIGGTFQAVLATQLVSTGHPDSRTTAYVSVPKTLHQMSDMSLLAAEIIELGTFDRDALGEAALANHAYASDLCDQLTQAHGYANRTAHDIVGRAVRAAIERNDDAITKNDLSEAARELGVPEPEIDLVGWTEHQNTLGLVNQRLSPGGASEDEVHSMVADFRSQATENTLTFSQWSRNFERQEELLQQKTKELADTHG